MISVVLYGRNDSYGYNLHKRGALSLNCIAEVLDDPDDEILFVDWNTPDDFPTFPEAIADTLTEKARRVLRILRVRPSQHARFAGRTHLVALESPARNVAVRRSNPANRWILSTNTDMIFVPRTGRSLSAIAAGLPDGYYHLPRFELPETLWEGLDRRDAPGTIAAIEAWARRYHLNEIVTLQEPAVRYDGPGDFQLALRADLHDLHGFDERMLLGWHVDSNIAVRLGLRHTMPGDVLSDIFGYHCDHTRQVTPAHKAGAVQNDWTVFTRDITEPRAPCQPDWGLGEESVEEVRIGGGARYLAALDAAIPAPMETPSWAAFGGSAPDRTFYHPDHVAPFVIDAISSLPRDTAVVWVASTGALLERFEAAWHVLGFTGRLQSVVSLPDGTLPAGMAEMLREADLLVFDFAMTQALRDRPDWRMLDDPAVAAVAESFRRAVAGERARAAGLPPRRFIAVNAVANSIESLVTARIGAVTAPYSTRIRQGYVIRPTEAPVETGIATDLLPRLLAGQGGASDARGLAISGTGVAFHAPARPFAPGFYVLEVAIAAGSPGSLVLEALDEARVLAARRVEVPAEGVRARLLFTVEAGAVVTVRGHADGGLRAAVTAASVRGSRPASAEPLDLMPFIAVGPAGRRTARGLSFDRTGDGFVFYGPYIALPAGRYRVRIDMSGPGTLPWRTPSAPVVLDVVDGAAVLAEISIPPARRMMSSLDFVHDGRGTPTFEVRLRKTVGTAGRVRRLVLEALADAPG